MLDYKLSVTVSDDTWNAAAVHAVLPQTTEEYFREAGATAMIDDTRRRHRRIRVRGRAIVFSKTNQCGVYTIDISPTGIGFFSPVQFLPKEKIEFYSNESEQIELQIRRCVRTAIDCYNCGGVFLNGPLSPGAYRNFLAALKA